MRFFEVLKPSLLCNSCNGSGKITYFMPECEKCSGYGVILEKVTPIKQKIIEAVLQETISMSDLSYIINSIRNMNAVKCFIQADVFTVKLQFSLDTLYGTIWFRPRRNGEDIGKVFHQKVRAASRSMNGGQAVSDETFLNNKMIRNRAIKILTNPTIWEVVGLRYDNFKI